MATIIWFVVTIILATSYTYYIVILCGPYKKTQFKKYLDDGNFPAFMAEVILTLAEAILIIIIWSRVFIAFGPYVT